MPTEVDSEIPLWSPGSHDRKISKPSELLDQDYNEKLFSSSPPVNQEPVAYASDNVAHAEPRKLTWIRSKSLPNDKDMGPMGLLDQDEPAIEKVRTPVAQDTAQQQGSPPTTSKKPKHTRLWSDVGLSGNMGRLPGGFRRGDSPKVSSRRMSNLDGGSSNANGSGSTPRLLRRRSLEDTRQASKNSNKSKPPLFRSSTALNFDRTMRNVKDIFNSRKAKNTTMPAAPDIERGNMLLTALLSGAPASALILSYILAEESSDKYPPILLDIISSKIVDLGFPKNSEHSEKRDPNDRMYRLELQYGSILKWHVIKSFGEFKQLDKKIRNLALLEQSKNFRPGKSEALKSFKKKVPKFPYDRAMNLYFKQKSESKHRRSHSVSPVSSIHSRASSVPTINDDDKSADEEFDNPDSSLLSSAAGPENSSLTERSANTGGRAASVLGSLQEEEEKDYKTLLEGNADKKAVADRNVTKVQQPERAAANELKTETVGPPRNSFLEVPESANKHPFFRRHVKDREFYLKRREFMENYLQRLLSFGRMKKLSQIILQFFEFSAMTLSLCYENCENNCEAYLRIASSASARGWKVSHLTLSGFKGSFMRHRSMWFLLRDSYIVVVEDLASREVQEVFLVDSRFSCSRDKHEGNSFMNTLTLRNGERKMKIQGGTVEVKKWIAGIEEMSKNTVWSKPNRFGSFAPIRKNVACRWFVDGRDYFWKLSEELDKAKDVIYIHGWWISPELYLRRPPEGNQKWRLDRILKRKAEQGVKIFVIMYRNYGQTIPIDSFYSKHSILNLNSENIFVMRSPNQIMSQTFFWAHHEKICLIDHKLAFIGGIDMCFGRWDTPNHALVDDSERPFSSDPNEKTQVWPGKDYSNARVKDFFSLDKPYEDMYNRNDIPRMPWHDVHMLVYGQPARDLCRHYVQRWNFLVRQKRSSRPNPLLLPPPDFTKEEWTEFKNQEENSDEHGTKNRVEGTCEVQILRSSGPWSLGLLEPEHSIQNAYCEAIKKSEHFVYIENQFFITSTVLPTGTVIENKIGDALVERALRAHEEGTNWKAYIVIPLMPGFESQVGEKDGSSVRMIMLDQFVSISRGPNSIGARLKARGIDPKDYINFFSLRKWGRVGPHSKYVTELLYIHAKTMVVDDRIAIIGSANINERSMRGDRDSELAAFIRDTDYVETRVDGKPYKAGKFPHSLRVRLMREHLGVDIDILQEVEKFVESQLHENKNASRQKTSTVKEYPHPSLVGGYRSFNSLAGEFNIGFREEKTLSTDSRATSAEHEADVNGDGYDGMNSRKNGENKRFDEKDEKEAILEEDDLKEAYQTVTDNEELTDKSRINIKRAMYEILTNQKIILLQDIKDSLEIDIEEQPRAVDPYCFDDPLCNAFFFGLWDHTAARNTEIFRKVFSCQPDDNVQVWQQYKDLAKAAHDFGVLQDEAHKKDAENTRGRSATGLSSSRSRSAIGSLRTLERVRSLSPSLVRSRSRSRAVDDVTKAQTMPDSRRDTTADSEDLSDKSIVQEMGNSLMETLGLKDGDKKEVPDSKSANEPLGVEGRKARENINEHADHEKDHHHAMELEGVSTADEKESRYKSYSRQLKFETNQKDPVSAYPRHNTWGAAADIPVPSIHDAERLLPNIRGNLVNFPYHWLAKEVENGNFFFGGDQLPPDAIYC